MRAKQFIRKINEAADESSVITTEVIKLISDGHTEVSPDVITAKVSAALGRPFMLKDLVSANNSSPELQHYIDSINPSKIKFSTDILTVKNQDPMKEKHAAQDGVAKMAARAGSRPRLGEGIINEATKDEIWQGWTIRYEWGNKKGQPVRWMAFHSKRGPQDAHKGQSDSVESALADAKAWIQAGGNAKEITTPTVTIDFNVKFANEIVNGNDFYAKIVQGPALVLSAEAKPGFKRSHIRTQRSKATQETTLLPMISLTNAEATSAGLKAHGRYLLGDTSRDSEGNTVFPLIYQSTVQAKGDVMRLGKPALTVAMNRSAGGLEEDQGISKGAETKFHAKLDKLVHDTFGKRKGEVEEGWSSTGDRVSLPDEPSTYWAGKGQLQKEYDALYNELVPSMGAADTIEGEVLRAASKIVYRHYNDGDEFNQASFDQLKPYIGAVTSYDDLAHKATEFAIKANGNYTPNQGWDSLDVMVYGPDDDYDDYEEDDSWDDDDEDEPHPGWDDEDEDLDESIPSTGEHRFRSLKGFIKAAKHLGLELQDSGDEVTAIKNNTILGEYSREQHVGWLYAPGTDSNEFKALEEARNDQVYTVNIVRRSSFGGDRRVRPTSGTLPELIEYFGYTLETGKSYEHERGRKKINMNPKTIESLVDNLNKAKSNAASNGHSSTYYELPDEQVAEAWQDGADLISQWNIPQQEWAQFEDAVESVIAATESDEAWEHFWKAIESDLQHLDRPVREAFERGLGSMDVSETTEYVLNGLRNGYESAGTEPRAALGLLTDIIEDGVRKLGMNEDWKKNLGTAALGAALAFGGAKAANAGQGPEQAPQKAAAAATQQAQAQNPYHNDLGVLVGVAQSKGGIQVLGKILSADQIQQVKAAYAKAKADPNLAKSAQFKQGQQLGFELGNSYADSSSQQMTDLNKRGPSYAGILSPMVVKPGEARSAEDITKVNQANAGKLKQAVTAAYGNMMAGGLQEGWESGPEERSSRERDPDDEYDRRRQEKLDIEAEKEQAKRPQKKVYTLTGRGPNYEPNYKFPGEYDSQEAAIAARAKLMADPKTPNPRDIGISSYTKYLDEYRETPLRDLEDYAAKKKALQDLQSDPDTGKDPELSVEVMRRLAGLEKQRSELK